MAASFSANAKSEVCRGIPQKRCCALAECFGILLFCNSFSASGIRIITESCDFAQNLPRLFKKAFGVTFDIVPDARSTGKMSFHVTQPEKIKAIMSAYGFDPADTLSLHINLPVVEDECCKASFFRGAFLAGGSVTDPVKGYHLELTTTHHCVAREAYALIHEVMNFYPKAMQRGGAEILYLKNSELISDFLTFLGAPICAMSIMETRLEKDLNNKVNRRCNCDEANTSKVVEAAQEQLVSIRFLKRRGLLTGLPTKYRQAADARLAHPEASLTELAAMMEPPITKPAMNNRLKRLMQLAKEKDK